MNYLHHPNLLVQFWAAVNTEFDKILDRFVRGDGWLFQDLGLVAKKSNIGAIHRCVCTVVNGNPGKEERRDHFLRVNFVILDAAKSQWLIPWRERVVDPSTGLVPPFLKRQVGGFFLLYMLYTNQPLPNRYKWKQKIIMDSKDLLAMHVFNKTMELLPKDDDQFRELARQLVVIFNDLATSEAFEFGAASDSFTTPTSSVRQLLANKFCDFTRLIYTVKDLRDQLYYITHDDNVKTFRSFVQFGKFLPQKEPEENKSKSKEKLEYFAPSDKKWTVEEIRALENENDIGRIAHNVSCILQSLDFGPILTRRRITGITDDLLDRELDHCVKTHTAYKKSRKRESRAAGNRKSFSNVLKQYYTEKYDWIDEILHADEKRDAWMPGSSAGMKDDVDGELNNATVDGVNIDNRTDDTEDDEWMDVDEDISDFDDEEDDDEIPGPSPKKHAATVMDTTKIQSPRRRTQRVLSMPNIL